MQNKSYTNTITVNNLIMMMQMSMMHVWGSRKWNSMYTYVWSIDWLIYLFKLWHSAKSFFHARIHKVTTYKQQSQIHTTYNTDSYNLQDNTYNIQWQLYNYNIHFKYLKRLWWKIMKSLKSVAKMPFWQCSSANLHRAIIAECTGHLVL